MMGLVLGVYARVKAVVRDGFEAVAIWGAYHKTKGIKFVTLTGGLQNITPVYEDTSRCRVMHKEALKALLAM